MPRHDFPISAESWSAMLRHMVAAASRARRLRLRSSFPVLGTGTVAPDDRRRRRAAEMLERTLASRSYAEVDCARLFERLATRLQLASGVIAAMRTAIRVRTMAGAHARALAIVVAELVYFAERAVSDGGSIRVYLVIAIDDGQLVVAVGVEGDVNPVSSAAASAALLRARSIVVLMRGDFQRGFDGRRLVFGMTFPPEAFEDFGS